MACSRAGAPQDTKVGEQPTAQTRPAEPPRTVARERADLVAQLAQDPPSAVAKATDPKNRALAEWATAACQCETGACAGKRSLELDVLVEQLLADPPDDRAEAVALRDRGVACLEDVRARPFRRWARQTCACQTTECDERQKRRLEDVVADYNEHPGNKDLVRRYTRIGIVCLAIRTR